MQCDARPCNRCEPALSYSVCPQWTSNLLHYREVLAIPYSNTQVKVLRFCDALWTVDGHWRKFSDHAKPVPEILERLQGCNVPEAHKKRKSQLDRESLLEQSDKMNECLWQGWLCASKWQYVRHAIVMLSDHMRDYAGYMYLESKCRELIENHKLQHSTRVESNADIFTLYVRKERRKT